MKLQTLIVLTILIALFLTGCAEAQVEETQAPAEVEASIAVVETHSASQADAAKLLPKGKAPVEGILVGGQPSPEQFENLAKLGYGTVINLRTAGEKGNTDPALIESLGMRYVTIPIGGAETLTEQNARKLAQVLDETEEPVVIHCASSNRVGGLLALKAFYVDGKSPDEALALGREAGMSRTEPLVRQALGLE